MLKNALKIQLKEQKKLFLPTDKAQGEPQGSLPNSHRAVETTSELQRKTPEMLKTNPKLQLIGASQEVDRKHDYLKERGDKGSDDESCDLFSDNLSDTQSNRSLSVALNTLATNKRRYFHLFVFVHGFQASSADMRSFRNSL